MNFPAMSVLFIILVTIILAATTRLSTAVDQPRPGCKTTCGNLTNINFPFGMSEECYLDEYFLITCNTTFEPPKAFYQGGNFPVLSISHEDSTMRIKQPISRICSDPSGYVFDDKNIILDTYSTKFPISDLRNKFIGIGCDTIALIGANHTTGCVVDCNGVENVVNGSCTGIGCCENKISKEMNKFNMSVYLLNHSRAVGFNHCSYVFLAEEGSYSFNSLDLWNMRGQDEFPVVLDWAVDEVPCFDAKRNRSSYACRSSNTECVNSTNGPGYHCKCSPGFRGNPYLYHGCKDIDECEENPNICGHGSICSNSPPGNYSCTCKGGYHKDGGICRKTSQKSIWHIVSVGVSISLSLLLLLVMGSLWIYLIVKKTKLMKQRERFFQTNGGFILRQQLSEQEDSVEKARIFTLEDLKRATNNYDESRIIGQGGSGTVYKGVLLNNREVAIKKSKISDQSQVQQFINEVVILSKINHVNVVKLIGCCLETEVPLLVYEFVSNGTLYHHIHNKSHASSLSWEMRLKIAAESAGAIAYIQYAISTPIIHRDIKSTNILLDDSYAPKVSDFGASIFFPLNKTQLTTFVQGTYGYLDPEYFHLNHLTKKSDVYSFGVLLAELLTGKEALSFDRPDEDRNLAAYFVSSIKDDRLVEILDDNLVKEVNIEQLREVAMLVKRCLRVKGKERPTMNEIATELEVIRVTNNNSWAATEFNTEE